MGSTVRPGQSLSPSQQNLLYTALASNRGSSSQTKLNGSNGNQTQSPLSADPSVFTSPNQGLNGELTDSPLFDQLDDGSFDFDNNEQLFGDVDDYENDYEETGDLHDKRKASGTSDDGDHKRQEGETKTPKKPGRKPITEIPTTKRKAQNRAAQRAFRERKEKHLKDLEVKVDDLEKASETTNHENGRLRAQVEKLSTEVKEYRKRLSMTNAAQSYSPPAVAPSRNPYENNDFSYAFPKFGDLPKSFMDNGSIATTSALQPQISRSSSGPVRQTSLGAVSPTNSIGNPFALPQTTSPQSFTQYNDNSLGDLTGLFSPSILQTASRSNSTDFGFPSSSSTGGTSLKNSNSFSNINAVNGNQQKPHRASSASTMNSPASSVPFDSSVGTTPEASGDNAASPESNTAKPADPASLLRTINEEIAPANQSPLTPADSFTGIDWMAAQNGGSFDPVLFGDYRDPQNNILDSLGDDFFTDAMGVRADFSSPYNTGDLLPSEPKKDMMKEIEATEPKGQNGIAKMDGSEVNWMAPNQVWDRAQSTPGWDDKSKQEIDVLCTQFKKKAQCSNSGKGAVVAEHEVDRILADKIQATQQNNGQSPLASVEKHGDHTSEGCEKAVRDAGVGGMFGSFL